MKRLRGDVLARVFLVFCLAGCGEEATKPDENPYLPQTSEANVLKNLQTSYIRREIGPYARLLADDFQFYFDEGTRQQNHNLPVFWTRLEDSTQTRALFEAPEVTDIRINLQFDEVAKPANGAGQERWTYIDVLDTFLEVDLEPRPGDPEGTTLRVDGQKQRFYFRKGRTPADTLVSSATSNRYYIVEWRDYGMQAFAAGPGSIETTTWGSIKSLFR